MTKIKLCGIKSFADIEYVNSLNPDYIGFVFAPKSKRYINAENAKKLKEKLNKSIKAVGVFVNEDIENIEYLVKERIIDMVQLHGSEDNSYIALLRQKVNCPIIQAFHIENEKDISKLQNSSADFVMTDSGGGTGKTFDHSLLKNINREFFLAGGLGSTNVQEIIEKYHPYGVDASSSLETDGAKDKNKMTAFVNAVKRKDETQ